MLDWRGPFPTQRGKLSDTWIPTILSMRMFCHLTCKNSSNLTTGRCTGSFGYLWTTRKEGWKMSVQCWKTEQWSFGKQLLVSFSFTFLAGLTSRRNLPWILGHIRHSWLRGGTAFQLSFRAVLLFCFFNLRCLYPLKPNWNSIGEVPYGGGKMNITFSSD